MLETERSSPAPAYGTPAERSRRAELARNIIELVNPQGLAEDGLDSDAWHIYLKEQIFTVKPGQDPQDLLRASTAFASVADRIKPPFDYQVVGALWTSIGANQGLDFAQKRALRQRVVSALPDSVSPAHVEELAASARYENHYVRSGGQSPRQIAERLHINLAKASEFSRILNLTDPDAREAIPTEIDIADYEGLAAHLARRFTGKGVPFDDLLQIARLGLLKASRRFDTSRGVDFSTFAGPTILGEIKRYFRDATWPVHVPRRAKEFRGRVEKEAVKFLSENSRAPTVIELAKITGLTPEEVTLGQLAGRIYRVMPLDTDFTQGASGIVAEERPSRRNQPTDTRSPELVDKVENNLALKDVFRGLSNRERAILELRFFDDLTQEEIGRIIGVSQMQVSRVLRKILSQVSSLYDSEDIAALL